MCLLRAPLASLKSCARVCLHASRRWAARAGCVGASVGSHLKNKLCLAPFVLLLVILGTLFPRARPCPWSSRERCEATGRSHGSSAGHRLSAPPAWPVTSACQPPASCSLENNNRARSGPGCLHVCVQGCFGAVLCSEGLSGVCEWERMCVPSLSRTAASSRGRMGET